MGVSAEAARAELARRELARRKAAAPAAAPAKEPTVMERFMRLMASPESILAEKATPAQVAKSGLEAYQDAGAGLTRLATKPGALVTAGAQAAGIPGADVASYNEGVRGLERDITGGREPGPTATVAELAGASLIPGAGMAGTNTLLRAIGMGAGTGAVTGVALGADPNAKTPGEVAASAGTSAAVGAGLGATLSTVGGIWPAAKNAVKRLMDLNRPVAATAANIAAKDSTAAFRAIPMTPGEQTGSPALLAYQAKLVGKESLAFQNKQLDQFGKALDDLTATMKGSPDPKGAAIKLKEAVGRTSGKLQGAASDAYGDGLRAVEAKAAEAPDGLEIPLPKFKKTLEDTVASYGGDTSKGSWFNWITPKTIAEDAKLQSAIRDLNTALATGQKGFDVATVARVKRAANYLRRGLKVGKDMSPGQQEQNRLGRSIADSIDDDVDAFLGSQTQAVAKGQSTATREALQMLDQVNAQYKVRLSQIADHRASFVSQMFGGQVPADAGEAFTKLLKMPEGEQIRAINMMRDLDPTILDDIKAAKMTEVSQMLRDQARAGNMSAIDPTVVAKSLTNGSKIIGERFWTPEELTGIKSAVGSARTLMSAMPTGKPLAGAEALDLGRTAGAAVTMSPPFVLMQMNRLFGRGRVAELFFTTEGQKALNTLAQTYTKPTDRTIKALTAIEAMTHDEE